MTIYAGEQNGVKGRYLDTPFCPRFFPDTPEGNAALGRQIDFEIRAAALALLIGAILILPMLGFAFWMLFTWPVR